MRQVRINLWYTKSEATMLKKASLLWRLREHFDENDAILLFYSFPYTS